MRGGETMETVQHEESERFFEDVIEDDAWSVHSQRWIPRRRTKLIEI